ncbi:hypothetical protein BOTBODRAFT_148481 [Botryobasidium botryosum FD-172 SS1]|uniref:[histone H3]-trimethyl-L-lysine(4) demethylase n=1 Tax=Botryobasidium botryosum (strain FD-172 SS1) TaxID=930990 RepID=A0A067M036_BOTB1|nr:hypothetical protein BOTBODRAFT_148481 [Botryobasidium botryosum FD-172 SS1]
MPQATPEPAKPVSRGAHARRGRRSGTKPVSNHKSSADIRPTSTFTTSLDISVPGVIPRPPSPVPDKDPLPKPAGSPPPAPPPQETRRAPRKSKTDALAALNTRSVSPAPISFDAQKNGRTNGQGVPATGSEASTTPPLDMSSVRTASVRDLPPRPVPRPFELEDCPTFFPTPDEFKDPMQYIRSISDKAKNYGLCKIVPPEGWHMPFVTDTKAFRFKTRVQRLNSIEASSRSKINFLEQLYRFHDQQVHSRPTVPTISHKALDLWLLRKEVHKRGGFDGVTRGRLWGDIGRTMGYEGVTAISTQLKNAYTRIILPFENFSARVRGPGATPGTRHPSESTQSTPLRTRMGRATRATSNRPVSSPHPTSSPTPHPRARSLSSSSMSLSDDDVDEKGNLCDSVDTSLSNSTSVDSKADVANIAKPEEASGDAEQAATTSTAGAEPATVSVDQPAPPPLGGGKVTPSDVPGDVIKGETCEICKISNRGPEMLLCDGCDCGFHMFCLDPPLTAIPRGQWFCDTCVFDTGGDFGFDEGEDHSLASFQARDRAFRRMWFESHPPKPPTWDDPTRRPIGKVSVSEDDVEHEFWRLVQSPHDTVEVEYGADVHSTTHGSAMPTMETHPLDPYAKDGWNLNNMPIVSDSLLRFIKSDISGMTVPWTYVGMVFSTFCWHNEDHYTYSINFMHWGETKTWYGIPGEDAEKFEAAIKSEAPDLFEAQPDLLFQLVTLMNPERLRNAGVRVFACNQRPGEFVVTLPQAYHAGFNHGINFNEAVNFALPDWLPFGRDCVQRYQEHQKLPVFSHDELLITITQHSQSIKTALWLHDSLKEMTDRELNGRRLLRDQVADLTEKLDEQDRPEDQYQCTVCKVFCYLSQVTCACTTSVACLEHAQSLCSCDMSKRRLVMRFSDKQLLSILNKVVERSLVPANWQQKLRTLLEGNPRPPFRALRDIVEEGEQIGVELPELPDLRRFVDRAGEWIQSAAPIAKEQKMVTRKRGRKSQQAPSETPEQRALEYSLDDVNSLLDQVEMLGFESSEISFLREALVQVENLQATIQDFLRREEQNVDIRESEAQLHLAVSMNLSFPGLTDFHKLNDRLHLVEELGKVDDHALTLDDVHRLLARAQLCELSPEHEYVKELQRMASDGEKWKAQVTDLLDQPAFDIRLLNSLASPPPKVPLVKRLLTKVDQHRLHAMETEKQAKRILSWPEKNGERISIEDAQRMVSRAKADYIIPAIDGLLILANRAVVYERKYAAILNGSFPIDPNVSFMEELRVWRTDVLQTLPMIMMPLFDKVNRQLDLHEKWLASLPWHATTVPAMRMEKILEDVAFCTRPEEDLPPVDPRCTCICTEPVVVRAGGPEAVQCDHCNARFHAACIDTSCPFCDHHHWNGAVPKPRKFSLEDLAILARRAPDLTRQYSATWRNLNGIVHLCTKLGNDCDAFMTRVNMDPAAMSASLAASTTLAQLRHFMRKLYRIQFLIKSRPDLPPFGLSFAHLHRMLSGQLKSQDLPPPPPPVPAPVQIPVAAPAPHPPTRRRLRKRPRFAFAHETHVLDKAKNRDDARCVCMGAGQEVGSWSETIACDTCQHRYHSRCVTRNNEVLTSPWRCPSCQAKKGKLYEYAPVLVKNPGDKDNVFVDYKECYAQFSDTLIKHTVLIPKDQPEPIILQLVEFTPGTNGLHGKVRTPHKQARSASPAEVQKNGNASSSGSNHLPSTSPKPAPATKGATPSGSKPVEPSPRARAKSAAAPPAAPAASTPTHSGTSAGPLPANTRLPPTPNSVAAQTPSTNGSQSNGVKRKADGVAPTTSQPPVRRVKLLYGKESDSPSKANTPAGTDVEASPAPSAAKSPVLRV